MVKPCGSEFLYLSHEAHFQILPRNGCQPAGVHLELTGEDVTECLGGHGRIGDEDLLDNYTSYCDPRLNATQSVELAFQLAEIVGDSD